MIHELARASLMVVLGVAAGRIIGWAGYRVGSPLLITMTIGLLVGWQIGMTVLRWLP